MRTLRRLAWAAAVAAGTAAPGLAQTTTGPTGATGSTATSGLTTGGTTGTIGGNTLTGGASGTTGAGGTGTTGGSGIQSAIQAPTISAPTTTGATTNRAVNASNFLGASYANPYYQGILTNNRTNVAPGGFGAVLFGTTGAAGGGNLGSATGTAGIGGTGAAGLGRTGAGGLGGATALSHPGGTLVQMPRAIAYQAQVRFAAPAVAPAAVLGDIRGVIDRTAMLSNPAGVLVQVDGRAVTLRGAVRDEDEAKLVEGLVRLTPGVGAITNELTFPK